MFEQGVIKIEKEREFGELKSAIEKAFSGDRAEKYLKVLQGQKIRVREFDAALAMNAIDQVNGDRAGTAQAIHGALPVSDQSQVREFYLSKLEEIDPALRAKFHKLYQYY